MKNRILFVDDEPNILSSMKRMLRGLRKHILMDFVESGPKALEAMAVEPYDVVISDMRMPGMDGAELLTSIRDRWPHTIRIMLTGQADSGSLLRTVNVVHQFLLKPCDQDEIKACIDRACELYSFLLGEGLTHVAADVLGLKPVLPQVYQDVQNLLLQDDCTVEHLAACVSQDEWLRFSIERLMNIGKPSCITMADAVRELGVHVLRPLILSLNLFQRLSEQRPEDELFERALIHGMRVAQYARRIMLAEGATDLQIVEVFIGGLLHDIGYLILANTQPELYAKVFKDLLEKGGSFDLCEEDLFSFSHNKAGALLLVRLGFPLGIIEIVAYHHMLEQQGDRVVAGLPAVHVADSDLFRTSNSSCCFRPALNRDYLAQMQCTDKVAAWQKIFKIDG